ncbi:MAG TPA: hypothetical protein VJ023_18960 [Pyrinomonadaceae bacterium]|nr:hypothetical protein [Pyrinomonadaceae bacterium]
MNKRPLSVVLIGYVFIAAGIFGFAYHVTDFQTVRPAEYAWVLLLRLLAIFGGVLVLAGKSWARWLLIAWLAYHTLLSAFHSASEFLFHGLLFAVIAYLLFRRPA